MTEPTAPQIDTSIPISLHPTSLDNVRGDLVTETTSPGNEIYRTSWTAFERSYAAFRDFAQAEADLRVAPAAVAEYEKAIDRVFSSASSALDRSLAIVKSNQEALTKKIDAALSHPEAKGLIGSELRSVVRSMPQADRATFALEAARAGDVPTVAALLAGPAVLSGLSDQVLATVKDALAATVVPQEHRQLQASQKVVDRLMAAGTRVLSRYQKATALKNTAAPHAATRLAKTGR